MKYHFSAKFTFAFHSKKSAERNIIYLNCKYNKHAKINMRKKFKRIDKSFPKPSKTLKYSREIMYNLSKVEPKTGYKPEKATYKITSK